MELSRSLLYKILACTGSLHHKKLNFNGCRSKRQFSFHIEQKQCILEFENMGGSSVAPRGWDISNDSADKKGVKLKFGFEGNVRVSKERFDEFHTTNRLGIDILNKDTEDEAFFEDDTELESPGEIFDRDMEGGVTCCLYLKRMV